MELYNPQEFNGNEIMTAFHVADAGTVDAKMYRQKHNRFFITGLDHHVVYLLVDMFSSS